MPTSPLARSLLIFGIGLATLLLGVAAWLYADMGRKSAVTTGATVTSGTALVGGPFELVDQNGAARSDADFHGSYMLIYFGYTYCPDVCPTSLLAMSQALDAFAEQAPAAAEQIVPIFITVDPERDTVEAMQAYAPHFHDRLVALTGSAEQVAQAAKGYRVFYRKAETDEAADYLMDHSSFVYLMDPEGGYLAHFSHTATAEQMAEKLAGYVGS